VRNPERESGSDESRTGVECTLDILSKYNLEANMSLKQLIEPTISLFKMYSTISHL
jgi:hypothetical protein